jgi:hypothetical protein
MYRLADLQLLVPLILAAISGAVKGVATTIALPLSIQWFAFSQSGFAFGLELADCSLAIALDGWAAHGQLREGRMMQKHFVMLILFARIGKLGLRLGVIWLHFEGRQTRRSVVPSARENSIS